MNVYNLYFLTKNPENLYFRRSEKILSGRSEMMTVKNHEIASAASLVSELYPFCPSPSCFDGFLFSYLIPHIGKEFDLLKINKNGILNIELKSVNVGAKAIREQLISNTYYLGHLQRPLSLMTYVMKDKKFYTLDDNKNLIDLSKEDAAKELIAHCTDYETDFDSLFEACDYLISPLTEPERFISGGYFLTQAQQSAKKKILSCSVAGFPFYTAITGSAGTGKTLLLYDLAKSLSEKCTCCFLHPGELLEGHRKLEKGIDHLTILPIDGKFEINDRFKYDLVFIDDVQRVPQKIFDSISSYCKRSGAKIFVTYDKAQYLSAEMSRENIPGQIEKSSSLRFIRLTDTVRTNRNLISLNDAILNKTSFTHGFDKDIFSVIYTDEKSIPDALGYYKEKSLPVIDLRKNTEPSPLLYAGAEYHTAVILLDGRYYYTKSGKLSAAKERGYLPMNLLRCALSRIEQHLIILTTDLKLYDELLKLLERN